MILFFVKIVIIAHLKEFAKDLLGFTAYYNGYNSMQIAFGSG